MGRTAVGAMAFLFTRMAKFEERSVDDSSDTKVYTHTVLGGESFATIAPKRGTTIASLKEHNPKANVIHPNQILKYRKARMDLVVIGSPSEPSVRARPHQGISRKA